jgi:glycosyltransferase involved in cell wall biosynthesis
MLPKAADYMMQHGMAPEKFVYVPNGICVDEWEQEHQSLPAEHVQALEAIRQQGHLIVGYTGAHGVANALDALVEAAALLIDQPVNFVLVGQGPEKQRLQEIASARGATNVTFLPPVAKQAVPALLARMDVVYIGLQKQPLFRFGVSPNKLMDYMMAGKPVLHAIEAGNDLVAESGCGLSIPAEDPAAIVQAVVRFVQMSAPERLALGQLGRQYVLARHDYRVLARQFLERAGRYENPVDQPPLF